MATGSSLHGTFSSSLRNRPVWGVLQPVITAKSRLQEAELSGYDFIFQSISQQQHLHVLLLTPSWLDAANKQETISSLKQFSTHFSSSPSSNAVAFLLSEISSSSASGKCSLDALLDLQVLIIESLETSLPVIPIPDSSCFLSNIEEYMRYIEDLPLPSPSLSDSMTLLAQATKSGRSLSEHDTDMLSDLVPSLSALSQATRTDVGKTIIAEYFGDHVAREIIEFWKDDWVCE